MTARKLIPLTKTTTMMMMMMMMMVIVMMVMMTMTDLNICSKS